MWFRVADGRTKCICTPGPVRLCVTMVVVAIASVDSAEPVP